MRRSAHRPIFLQSREGGQFPISSIPPAPDITSPKGGMYKLCSGGFILQQQKGQRVLS